MALLPSGELAPPPILGELGVLDHYTVCVENAQAACDFHVNVLGFKFLRTQHINSGTVPAGEIDMLNFVLALPSAPERTCIITAAHSLSHRTNSIETTCSPRPTQVHSHIPKPKPSLLDTTLR